MVTKDKESAFSGSKNLLYTSFLLVVFFFGIAVSFVLVSVGVVESLDAKDVEAESTQVLGVTAEEDKKSFSYPSSFVPQDFPSFNDLELIESWEVDKGGVDITTVVAQTSASVADVAAVYESGFAAADWKISSVVEEQAKHRIAFEKWVEDPLACKTYDSCRVSGYLDIVGDGVTKVTLRLGVENAQ